MLLISSSLVHLRRQSPLVIYPRTTHDLTTTILYRLAPPHLMQRCTASRRSINFILALRSGYFHTATFLHTLAIVLVYSCDCSFVSLQLSYRHSCRLCCTSAPALFKSGTISDFFLFVFSVYLAFERWHLVRIDKRLRVFGIERQ
jgi:hypothetical protein